MILRKFKNHLSNLVAFILLSLLSLLLLTLTLLAEKNAIAAEDTAAALTNFSFASYLGTGFYTTSGQRVFVLQLPLDYSIKTRTDTEAGILLKLPVTIGLINFDSLKIEELPELTDVTTITFLPGIEYQHPITPDWYISPFFDYGFARDLNNDNNTLIIGLGVKSSVNFHLDNAVVTLGNRFLYAREKIKDIATDSDYSLIETGLNYRVISDYSFAHGPMYSNLYYINFYYPNNLVFLEQTQNPIRVGVEHEVGITISNLPDFLFFEKPQVGLGVRLGKDLTVYRLIFGAPF